MIKNWTVGRPGNEARYTDAQNKGDGHLASREVGSGRGGGATDTQSIECVVG